MQDVVRVSLVVTPFSISKDVAIYDTLADGGTKRYSMKKMVSVIATPSDDMGSLIVTS